MQQPVNLGKSLFLWPAASSDLREAAVQLRQYGYTADLFDSATDLFAAEAGRPTSALVDADAVAGLSEADRAALLALSEHVPLACISGDGGIGARLGAVRMGCQAYFTRPLDMTSLLDSLDRLTAPPLAEAGKVLIVDDSPALSAFYAAHLNAAGFVTQVVNDPLKTLEALDEHPPELILLDMNMPGASGEEIAEVIRQQDAYLSTPIVFLSAESDMSRQREAMSLGGDEFQIGRAHV